jgi:uncharacterized protein YbjT (DUF2867 family)
MARILVAGGTGVLGSAVVEALKTTPHVIRIMSSRAAPANRDLTSEWATVDITTETGLRDALADVDIVVNCLGNYRNVYQVDVLGTQRLADLSKEAGIQHFYHISIVGIDKVDYDFYRHKQAAEAAVIASGVPYSIQRVTQFHSYMFYLMSNSLQSSPDGYVLPITHNAIFQPMDTHDIAAYALPMILDSPAQRLPDVGGPEIWQVADLARIFLSARQITNPVFVDPGSDVFPDTALGALRKGVLTEPRNRYGQMTWADYVRERYKE